MRIWSELSALICCICFCCYNILEANADDNIKLRFYHKNNANYKQADISQAEILFQQGSGYNSSLPLVLLIHGISMGADCYFVNGLIDAFGKRSLTNEYNIFAVDMPTLFENSMRNEFYIGILSNVQPAGEIIGNFLSKVIKLKQTTPEKINIIGYSMGAQVAGYAARVVKNNFGKINFIAGLDPAGPGFHTTWSGRPTMIHVSAADATTTHFYHTNSISCGTRDRIATADFVFNKGTVQPGCTKDKGIDCSHTRVPNLYIEAVSKSKNFIARECPSWKEFRDCRCNHHKYVSITFPPNTSAKGIYHLRTRSKSPFALGKKGSLCGKLVHTHSRKHTLGAEAQVRKNIERIKDSLHYSHKFKNRNKKHLVKKMRKSEGRHRYVTHNISKQKHDLLEKKDVKSRTTRVTEEDHMKNKKEDRKEDKKKYHKDDLKKDQNKDKKEVQKETQKEDHNNDQKEDKNENLKIDHKEDRNKDQKEDVKADHKNDLKMDHREQQKEDPKDQKKD